MYKINALDFFIPLRFIKTSDLSIILQRRYKWKILVSVNS